MGDYINNSIMDVINKAPWKSLELHLNSLKSSIDVAIYESHELRNKYRTELLNDNPDILNKILRPSNESLQNAQNAFKTGVIAAADGTIAPVPLLSGSKIQVGVVIVSNRGDVVDLVTKVFETELSSKYNSARDYFQKLRSARSISNLLSRAIMLFGERRLLFEHQANWRFIHGELIPHELRTGAGRPDKNLPPTFDLMYQYINSKNFIAVSEATDDIDILNAAVLLEPGEYIEIRTLEENLNTFLSGDVITGQAAANLTNDDKARFREFISSAGPQVSEVLVKAGNKPFIIECHKEKTEEAVSMFLTDALWVKGLETDSNGSTIRGFPFHIDLADQVARTLFKGSDFRNIVETRLFEIGIEAGLFDIDPRRTRG